MGLQSLKLNVRLNIWGASSEGIMFGMTPRDPISSRLAISSIFLQKLGEEHPEVHFLIFGDSLSANKDIPTSKKMLRYSVPLCCLPEKTSHFLQPLDLYHVAPFNKRLSAIYENIELHCTLIGDCDPLRVCAPAMQQSIPQWM